MQAGQNSMQILNVRERLLWHLRSSVSSPVIAHDQVAHTEHSELVIPFAAMEATTVQQHEWLPMPISLVVEPSSIDRDKTCFAHLRCLASKGLSSSRIEPPSFCQDL